MKQLEKWLKQFLIFLIKTLLPGRIKDLAKDEWKSYKSVLVFRLDNRFGNAILILSLIQSIKKSIPDASVDVMMTSSYVAMYKSHPAIHQVIPYDQKYLFRNPLRFLFLINQLRKNKYDAVFSSNNPDAFSVSQAIFNRLVTKNRSVGFAWKESDKIYTDVVKGNTDIHYSQSQFDLWHYFDNNAEYTPPRLYYISKNNISPEHSILIWLGATGNKFVPEELVNSVVEAIKELNIDLHLAVGPHDQKVKDMYTHSWRENIQTINLDLEGIARYFLNFKCVIMPDTGPMHLVAAIGISLVQVFVNSNIGQYGYIGPNRFIIENKIDTDLFKQFIKTQINSVPEY
jgi:ADP-heptose:LPS heptosyltransferase